MRIVVTLRVLDEKGSRVFGDGIAELLARIDETGSIAEAARGMGMAYSKAWRIIRTLEKALERPALVREKGGRARGGARLTPVARKLLDEFIALRDRAWGTMTADAVRRLLARFPKR